MKLAFVAPFDIHNVHKRSGTPFYMAKNMEKAGISLDYLCPLKTKLPIGFKLKRTIKKLLCGQHELSRSNIYTVKRYAEQVKQKLAGLQVDAVIAHILDPLAYLECKEPKVVWTDAAYGSLLGFNPDFCNHSATGVKEATIVTRQYLSSCKLAIFSSDWAARGALEIYGASREKVKVVPFGANIECNHTLETIRDMLKLRSRHTIKLLFLAKQWHLKGGDKVIAVASELHRTGHAVELTLVGCYPPDAKTLPPYIKCLGYISKKSPEGSAQLHQLLRESHFLFVPSRSEAFGIVFCEANAFGLPCLTSYVGGITTIVKDHINGMTFSLDATPADYCRYIVDLMQNYSQYEQLALSAFHEYETRLNWQVSVNKVKQLIQETL